MFSISTELPLYAFLPKGYGESSDCATEFLDEKNAQDQINGPFKVGPIQTKSPGINLKTGSAILSLKPRSGMVLNFTKPDGKRIPIGPPSPNKGRPWSDAIPNREEHGFDSRLPIAPSKPRICTRHESHAREAGSIEPFLDGRLHMIGQVGLFDLHSDQSREEHLVGGGELFLEVEFHLPGDCDRVFDPASDLLGSRFRDKRDSISGISGALNQAHDIAGQIGSELGLLHQEGLQRSPDLTKHSEDRFVLLGRGPLMAILEHPSERFRLGRKAPGGLDHVKLPGLFHAQGHVELGFARSRLITVSTRLNIRFFSHVVKISNEY